MQKAADAALLQEEISKREELEELQAQLQQLLETERRAKEEEEQARSIQEKLLAEERRRTEEMERLRQEQEKRLQDEMKMREDLEEQHKQKEKMLEEVCCNSFLNANPSSNSCVTSVFKNFLPNSRERPFRDETKCSVHDFERRTLIYSCKRVSADGIISRLVFLRNQTCSVSYKLFIIYYYPWD